MTTPETPDDQHELEKLTIFKNGYQPLTDRQTALARSAIQVLSAPIVSQEERRKLTVRRQEIDRALEEIQKLSRELANDLSPSSLEKAAQRDYHNIFAGDISEHRLSFVQFLEACVYLNRYRKLTRESWELLEDSLRECEIQLSSELYQQLTSNCLRPASEVHDALVTYCERMGRILRLQADPLRGRQLSGLGIYHPEIPYQLSTVFRENLNAWLDSVSGGNADDSGLAPEQLEMASLPERSTTPTGSSIPAPAKNNLPDWRLDASGQAAFNQSSHYFFQYDPRLLEQEREKFAHVVYADTHMGADQQFIKSDFILNVSRKSRQEQAAINVEEEYVNFLHSFFNLVVEISMLNVGIHPPERDVFIYHLGPQSFYNLTIKFLQEVNTGALHRRAPGRQVITRFIPGELIKKTILEWWRSEILPRLPDEQRNDPARLKNITGAVRRMHESLSKKAIEEYDRLPPEIKNAKPRTDIFRENMSRWMGATNIIIFRRFLKSKK